MQCFQICTQTQKFNTTIADDLMHFRNAVLSLFQSQVSFIAANIIFIAPTGGKQQPKDNLLHWVQSHFGCCFFFRFLIKIILNLLFFKQQWRELKEEFSFSYFFNYTWSIVTTYLSIQFTLYIYYLQSCSLQYWIGTCTLQKNYNQLCVVCVNKVQLYLPSVSLIIAVIFGV